jgi:hypothetical protein
MSLLPHFISTTTRVGSIFLNLVDTHVVMPVMLKPGSRLVRWTKMVTGCRRIARSTSPRRRAPSPSNKVNMCDGYDDLIRETIADPAYISPTPKLTSGSWVGGKKTCGSDPPIRHRPRNFFGTPPSARPKPALVGVEQANRARPQIRPRRWREGNFSAHSTRFRTASDPNLLSPTGADRFCRSGRIHGLPATASGRGATHSCRFGPAHRRRIQGYRWCPGHARRRHRRFETQADGHSRHTPGVGGRSRASRWHAIHPAGPPGSEGAPNSEATPKETGDKAFGGEGGAREEGLAHGDQCGSRSWTCCRR